MDVKISDWCNIKAWVQRGTLSTILIQINDLQTVISGVKYVDDSSLWEAFHKSGGSRSGLNMDSEQ